LETKKQLTACLRSSIEEIPLAFFLPKRAGYPNIPQALKVVQQENSFGSGGF